MNLAATPNVLTAAEICPAIADGSFMPFVGAGASLLRPLGGDDSRWAPVANQIARLRDALSAEEKADQLYLLSHAKAHGLKLPVHVHEVHESSDVDQHLFTLQLALIRASSVAVGLFGEGMIRSRDCLADLDSHSVIIPQNHRFIDLLIDAVQAARALEETVSRYKRNRSSRNTTSLSLLGDRRISESLLRFACHAAGVVKQGATLKTPDQLQPYADQILKLCAGCTTCSNDAAGGRIRLDELAWLEDLLWHLLRFRVPVYPSAAELTFIFTLTALRREIRRGELPQVADYHGQFEEQRDLIRDWFSYCEDAGGEPPEFHAALAAALIHEYRQYENAKNGDLLLDGRPRLSVVFTTNYDRLLETTLDGLGSPYHVVFPVQARKGNQYARQWLFVTHYPESYRRLKHRQEPPSLICDDWKRADTADRKVLEGPVVVKLHGSLLENLPHPNQLKSGSAGIEDEPFAALTHALVLSESSYLEAIVGHSKYPAWIEAELKSPYRTLWFLGYSLRDWNVRLRLYEHLFHSLEAAGNEPQDNSPDEPTVQPHSKVAVDYYYDPFRSSVLKTLDVMVVPGSLENFAVELARCRAVKAVLDEATERGADR